MAWANLQKPAAAAGATLGAFTLAQTFGSALTNGSRIIVAVSCWIAAGNSTCSGVADTVNTYTKDGSIIDAVSKVETSIFSAPNTSSSALTVTATMTQSGSTCAICIMEFSGLSSTAGAGALDGTGTASVNGATSITTTSATTHAANELAVCAMTGNGDNRTFTKDATYTAAQNNSPDGNADIGTEYKDTGASGSAITGAWTISAGSGHNDAVLVIYKLPTLTVGRPPRNVSQAVNRAATY
jgi:hypothetical protein